MKRSYVVLLEVVPRMKRLMVYPISVAVALLASIGCATANPTPTQAAAGKPAAPPALAISDKTFYIYSDKGASTNHFAPSGWMGDYGDLKLDEASAEKPAQ